MARTIISIIVVAALLALLAGPAYCKANPAKAFDTSMYLKGIGILGFIFVLLLVWEVTEWMKKRKMTLRGSETSETISVVDDHADEDPFKALLREETASAASSVTQVKEKEARIDVREEMADIKEEYKPALSDEDLVARDERRDRPRKVVVVEAPLNAAPQTPSAPRESAATPVRLPDQGISEDGWRELMARASQEAEEKVPKPAEVPAPPAPERDMKPAAGGEEEEEDPWKALLRKSKQEEVGIKEEDKPWSAFLKGERKTKEIDEEKKLPEASEPVSIETSEPLGIETSEPLSIDTSEPLSIKTAEPSSPETVEQLMPESEIMDIFSESPSRHSMAAEGEEEKSEEAPPDESGESDGPPPAREIEEKPLRGISSAQKKKAIPLVVGGAKESSDEPKLERKRDKPQEREAKAIELGLSKKKEDRAPEKKSSSLKKRIQAPGIKRTPRVLSLSGEEPDGNGGAPAGDAGENRKIADGD